ncbi:MAG: NADPH-dependent F420 reductase [Trueperaceae bacterium]
MNIGILGTGMVGQVVGAALAAKDHSVMIGTRDVQKSLASSEPNAYGLPAFGTWHKDNTHIKVGTFAETAKFGELLVNATSGLASLEALKAAGTDNLGNKVLIDIANELDFSKGMPPRALANTDRSLGEDIQAAFPNLKVVKTLNTMNAFVMVNPTLVKGGDSTVFINGNDAAAKAQVAEILKGFGWQDIMDLGDITASRSVEMILPLWLRAWGVIGNTPFNFKIAR